MAEPFDSTRSIDALLDALEAAAPSPAGGTTAAVTAAMAASLVVMVARESPSWADGSEVARKASALRDRLVALSAEDVEAFADVLTASRTSDARALAGALVRAAEVPLEIAERAADVTALAVRAATYGKRPLQPDAEAALTLAEAATRAASLLVYVNVAALPPTADETVKARLSTAAQATVDRAASASR